jgi:NitT/TauT family transport system substrate-binding protein
LQPRSAVPGTKTAEQMKRRLAMHWSWLRGALVVLGSWAVAASVQPALAATTVKLATTTWIGYGPFYVAESLGLYSKYGVEAHLKTFSDPAMLPPALASAAVDGALMTYDQVIGAVAQGQGFKVVMPIDYSNGGDAILASLPISKVLELKGKKVAYAPLSPSDFLMSYALQVNGLTEKDIQPVNMAPEAVPAAMVSGAAPGGVTYEPSVSQILSTGGGKKFAVIYSSKDAPGLITDVLVFDGKRIPKQTAVIGGVIKGYIDGLAYMKAKPAEAAKIIGKALGVSDKEVLEQLKGVYNIPPEEMGRNFVQSKATTSFYGSGAVVGSVLMKKGQIKAVPPIAATLDDQFVKTLGSAK